MDQPVPGYSWSATMPPSLVSHSDSTVGDTRLRLDGIRESAMAIPSLRSQRKVETA